MYTNLNTKEVDMQTRVQKWGNSFGIRISMQIAKQLHLHPGSPVALEIENGKLVVRNPEYDLNTMMDAITPENSHHLVLDDTQKGNEEW